MSVKLQKDIRGSAVASIRKYSEDNFEDPLRNLATGALLDFFLEEIAPSVYNKAVSDVQRRLQGQILELDLEIHEEEFEYSRKRGWKTAT